MFIMRNSFEKCKLIYTILEKCDLNVFDYNTHIFSSSLRYMLNNFKEQENYTEFILKKHAWRINERIQDATEVLNFNCRMDRLKTCINIHAF